MKANVGLAATLAAGLLWPRVAWACSVCAGNPDSVQRQSAVAGVVTLGVIIMAVVASIVATAIQWTRRARELEAQAAKGEVEV